MRDLINKLNIIFESTGLAGRKTGDVFRNPEGEEIKFVTLKLFPKQGGSYTSEQLNSILNKINKQKDIKWLNLKTAGTGGFGIATFEGPDGEIYYGRYLKNIKPNFTDNSLPNIVGTYKFSGKSAVKAQAGLSPQDLLTKKDNLSSKDIVEQLSQSLGIKNPLYLVAYNIASGESLPIEFPKPEGVSFSAFRDYFCEILQPMALQNGQYTGNAGEAAEIFLDGDFSSTLISFDTAKTAGLSDSIMTTSSGKYVKISTKGGKGAEASSKNLLDSIDELKNAPAGQKLIKKYKKEIDLLNDIKSAGQANAPLLLGEKFGIINSKEADKVRELKSLGPINLKNIGKLKLGENLEKLANNRTTKTPNSVNLYYHLIAAIAHKAAAKVNEETDFSKAASDILNNGALIQVYTKARETSLNWILEGFNTVYPSDNIKGVYLSAQKNYASTGIKGNFTFRIDKGAGVPDETNEPSNITTVEPNIDLAKISKKIIEPKRKVKTKPNVEPNVGREKRKK